MNPSFTLRIFEGQRSVYNQDFVKPVELGRQDKGEDPPYSKVLSTGRWRLIVAGHAEESVSRRQVLLAPVSEFEVRVENVSRGVPIRYADDTQILAPGESKILSLPFSMNFGRRTIRLVRTEAEVEAIPLQSLNTQTAPPGGSSNFPTKLALNLQSGSGISPQEMIHWLKVTIDVLQAAAGLSDFFPKAAQAAVDLVGLDSARVLLHEEGEWIEKAHRTAKTISTDYILPPSKYVLRRLYAEKKTFWEVPELSGGESASIDRLSAVVAAPIMNRDNEVIGALYGDRSTNSPYSKIAGKVTELEASLVEVLAGSVSAGLERLAQEKKAIEAHVLFEQFFTPELAREITENRVMLESRASEVTLLFCDIRGFSRVSEQLGPAGTMDWINDVMGALSDCVRNHQGVLVDYIGDELMAMWGAPKEVPDHAGLACMAALEMIEVLPSLNDRWRSKLNTEFEVGIGINTGTARVGNTGTKQKFKYGPLGNTVNLASRVQGATKHFKTRLLITEDTQKNLHAGFCTRRLGLVRVINIAKEFNMYELLPPTQPNWELLRKQYEQALDHFEKANFGQAARTLGILQLEYPNDGPSLVLLSRVVQAKVDIETYDPIWTLPSK